MKDCEVIGFDIDGTLYPSWCLNLRLITYFFSHFSFFIHYCKVRKILHRTAPSPDFYEYQARLLAEEMKVSVDVARLKVQNIVYDGMRPFFKKIRPYKDAVETIKKFHKAGYRIVLLSDFPPEQKGDIWGVIPYCEKIWGTEQIGALKPSKYPFGIMANELNVKPFNILYVGNSIKHDIIGAKNAGMRTAYLLPWWKRLFHIHVNAADITFCNYRQLQNIVLN